MSLFSDEHIRLAGADVILHNSKLQELDSVESSRDATSEKHFWPPQRPMARPFASSLTRVLAVALASLAVAYLVLRCFHGLYVGYRQGGASRALASWEGNAGDQCSDNGGEDESLNLTTHGTGEAPEDWIGYADDADLIGLELSRVIDSFPDEEGWENRDMPTRARSIFAHYLERIEAMATLCGELEPKLKQDHFFSVVNRVSKILVTQLGLLSLNPTELESNRERAGEAIVGLLKRTTAPIDGDGELLRLKNMNRSLVDLTRAVMRPREDTKSMTSNFHKKRVLGAFKMLQIINGHLMNILANLRILVNYPNAVMTPAEIETQIKLLEILQVHLLDRMFYDQTAFWHLKRAQKYISQYLLFNKVEAFVHANKQIPPSAQFEADLNNDMKQAGGMAYIPLSRLHTGGKSPEGGFQPLLEASASSSSSSGESLGHSEGSFISSAFHPTTTSPLAQQLNQAARGLGIRPVTQTPTAFGTRIPQPSPSSSPSLEAGYLDHQHIHRSRSAYPTVRDPSGPQDLEDLSESPQSASGTWGSSSKGHFGHAHGQLLRGYGSSSSAVETGDGLPRLAPPRSFIQRVPPTVQHHHPHGFKAPGRSGHVPSVGIEEGPIWHDGRQRYPTTYAPQATEFYPGSPHGEDSTATGPEAWWSKGRVPLASPRHPAQRSTHYRDARQSLQPTTPAVRPPPGFYSVRMQTPMPPRASTSFSHPISPSLKSHTGISDSSLRSFSVPVTRMPPDGAAPRHRQTPPPLAPRFQRLTFTSPPPRAPFSGAPDASPWTSQPAEAMSSSGFHAAGEEASQAAWPPPTPGALGWQHEPFQSADQERRRRGTDSEEEILEILERVTKRLGEMITDEDESSDERRTS